MNNRKKTTEDTIIITDDENRELKKISNLTDSILDKAEAKGKGFLTKLTNKCRKFGVRYEKGKEEEAIRKLAKEMILHDINKF